jgi:hypothetical protein
MRILLTGHGTDQYFPERMMAKDNDKPKHERQ